MNPEGQNFSLPSDGGTLNLRFDPASPLQIAIHINAAKGVITLYSSPQGSQAIPPSVSIPDPPVREPLQRAYVEQGVAQIFAVVLELPPDEVTRDTDFFVGGGDSLGTVAVVSAVRERFCIHVDPVEVFDHPAVSDLATVVLERCANLSLLAPGEEEHI